MKAYHKESGCRGQLDHKDSWTVMGQTPDGAEETIAIVNTESVADALLAVLRQDKKIKVVVDLSGGVVNEIIHDDATTSVEIVFLGDKRDCNREPSEEVFIREGYFSTLGIYSVSQSQSPPIENNPVRRSDIERVFEAAEEYANK